MTMVVEDSSKLAFTLISMTPPTWGMLTREKEDVASYTDPNADIKERVYVAEGDTIALIAL